MGETHTEGTSYAASVVGASKRFGPTAALREVSIDLRAGEIHALVGENGAGKSTLIKLITGLVRPDDGHLVIAGERVELKNPADALARGVGCIYQEPLMFPDLSVSENIFAGRARGSGRSRFVRWRDMHDQAAEILGRLDVDVDPRAPGVAADGGRSAGGGDREGHVPGCADPDHGRADGRARQRMRRRSSSGGCEAWPRRAWRSSS